MVGLDGPSSRGDWDVVLLLTDVRGQLLLDGKKFPKALF